MSKLRVHELARELGRQNREVIEFLKSKGVDVRSHMSMVDEPAVSEVKNRFRKDNNNRGKEHIAKLETPKTEEKVVQPFRFGIFYSVLLTIAYAMIGFNASASFSFSASASSRFLPRVV